MYKWFKRLLYVTPIVALTTTVITDEIINLTRTFDLKKLIRVDSLFNGIELKRKDFWLGDKDKENNNNLFDTVSNSLRKNYSVFDQSKLDIKYFLGNISEDDIDKHPENLIPLDSQSPNQDIFYFTVVITSKSSEYSGRSILNIDIRPRLSYNENLFLDTDGKISDYEDFKKIFYKLMYTHGVDSSLRESFFHKLKKPSLLDFSSLSKDFFYDVTLPQHFKSPSDKFEFSELIEAKKKILEIKSTLFSNIFFDNWEMSNSFKIEGNQLRIKAEKYLDEFNLQNFYLIKDPETPPIDPETFEDDENREQTLNESEILDISAFSEETKTSSLLESANFSFQINLNISKKIKELIADGELDTTLNPDDSYIYKFNFFKDKKNEEPILFDESKKVGEVFDSDPDNSVDEGIKKFFLYLNIEESSDPRVNFTKDSIKIYIAKERKVN